VGLASSNEPKLIFDSFFTFSSNSDQIIVIIVQAMQMIGMLLIVFVIINMCVFNRKRCIIDHASDTCVIKFVDVNSKEANDSINALNRDKGPQRKYRLPGEITTEINDEIDSL
jgi:hypothetical protein